MSSGWIKIHRKIWDNPVVTKDSDHLAVWIWLLTHAAHQDYDTLYGGKRVTLHPGQLIIGRKIISKELHIHEQKVKRIINVLKSEQQIDHYGKPYGSLITIVNWDKYQISDQQNDQRVTNERPTSDQRVTTIQEYKEDKEDKEDKETNIHTYKYGGRSVREIIRERVKQ